MGATWQAWHGAKQSGERVREVKKREGNRWSGKLLDWGPEEELGGDWAGKKILRGW